MRVRALYNADPVTRTSGDSPVLSWPIAGAITGLSIVAVYCTYVSLHTIDVETGAIAANESLRQYRDALAGARDFPYQWRLLGIYLVFAGERLTRLEPHTIDIIAKTTLLWLSSSVLFLFSRFYASEIGSLAIVVVYLLLTIAGFSDQYTIYFTNDYAVIACWFGAVYCVASERYIEAAILTLVGSLAKETMLLVPVLLALRWWRGRAPFWAVAMAAAGFLLPTAVLRTVYRAPVGQWAWWRMLFVNVPFLQSSVYELSLTLKNNLKVALFFNVFWLLAARHVLRRSADRLLTDLALTGVVYLALAYPVIYIRELRHFLPLAIVVLPAAIAEIEQQSAPAIARRPKR
jgi:hypothetical protein